MHQPGEFLILADGKPLMSSRMHGSEEAMAEVACRGRGAEPPPCWSAASAWASRCGPRSTSLPADATVVVAELVAGVVEWNRGPLGPLANHPLRDRRVHVEVTPVDVLKATTARFDVGAARRRQRPIRIHDPGKRLALHRLRPGRDEARAEDGGTLAVWSAQEDRRFEQRLKHAGFAVTVERVRARLKKGGPRHVIFVGRLERSPPVARRQDARDDRTDRLLADP